MTDDIFNLDDRVIDKNTRDKAECEQRQKVEREAHQIHEPEGGYRRQGNSHSGNQRCTPVAQEQPHNQNGKNRPFDHRMDGGLILCHGVVDAGEQLDERDLGVGFLERVELLVHGFVDRDFGRALRPLDSKT